MVCSEPGATSDTSTRRLPDKAPAISVSDSRNRVRCPDEGSPAIGPPGQTER